MRVEEDAAENVKRLDLIASAWIELSCASYTLVVYAGLLQLVRSVYIELLLVGKRMAGGD